MFLGQVSVLGQFVDGEHAAALVGWHGETLGREMAPILGEPDRHLLLVCGGLCQLGAGFNLLLKKRRLGVNGPRNLGSPFRSTKIKGRNVAGRRLP